MKNQRGLTFLGVMVFVCIAVFVLITASKLIPPYMEYQSVKKWMSEVTGTHLAKRRSGQLQLQKKINRYLSDNDLTAIKPENFSVVDLDESTAKALAVQYEVRKHWLANIDLTLRFDHTEEFKGQN